MDEYEAQRYIRQQLSEVQNIRRIKFNIHKWGLQFDGGIISNRGNPQLVWNYLGKSKHRSTVKHLNVLKEHGVKEFEINLASYPKLYLTTQQLIYYIKLRRNNGNNLKVVTM